MSLWITSVSVCSIFALVAWIRWTTSGDTEARSATHLSVVAVLEKQPGRCGPVSLHCPPARDHCSCGHTLIVFLGGVCLGFLLGVAVVVCRWYQHCVQGYTAVTREVNEVPPRADDIRFQPRVRGAHLALSNLELSDLGY